MERDQVLGRAFDPDDRADGAAGRHAASFEPPAAGEIWRSREDPAGAVMVLRCDSETVDYTWLDRADASDGRLPAAQWQRRFEVVLEHPDHAQATPVRRHWLIDRQADAFRDRRVLELGAHSGGLTESLLAHAASVTAVENNRHCVRRLRERFGERLRLVADDMHHALWRLTPGEFDTIVCVGVLYHSAHPFLLLEAMAWLRPRAILIDTLNHGVADLRLVVPHLINSCNYRYNPRPDCGYSLVLGDAPIEQAMRRLGYATVERIDKSGARIAPEHEGDYFREWKRGLSAWFRRDDVGGQGAGG